MACGEFRRLPHVHHHKRTIGEASLDISAGKIDNSWLTLHPIASCVARGP
jgi:hypothetical protein